MQRLSYRRVFLTFARNSLIRDMTFQANFLLQCITAASWSAMNIGFYVLVFEHTRFIDMEAGWGRYEFFVFLATTWFINSLVQAFFMPNANEFSELIRTGNLDFALLKPIDTQFLVSLQRVEWSSLTNFGMALALLVYSLWHLVQRPSEPVELSFVSVGLYVLYLVCGVAILYSLMISLAATSIWLGRNQSLYDFWFYITNFARYPMEIYQRGWGMPLWFTFTFVIPVLVVINVPARIMAQPISAHGSSTGLLALYALLATVGCLLLSRGVFSLALRGYRSASS